MSCFLAIDVLCARFGEDIPYHALAEGFNFRGRRVPFLNRAYGIYQPIYPTFVERDLPAELSVLLTFGEMRGPYDEREPVHISDEIERRYAVRAVKQRIHQAQFRGAVLPAYRERCAVCRLREVRLLDAAHIVADAEQAGEPIVSNGLSLCSIHHRAYDQDLVGVSPDYRVHLSPSLLQDEDGPMLDVLKRFEGAAIEFPSRRRWHPDRERLAVRFERFRSVAA